MIDQKKLHHPITTIFDQWRISSNPHSLRNPSSTTDLWSRHPRDIRLSVLPQYGRSIGVHLWGTHLKETHPAIAHHRQLRMVAVVWNKLFGSMGNLDHIQTLGHLQPNSVDLHVDQIQLILGHIMIPGIHRMGLATAHIFLNGLMKSYRA
jgi:hypothetical protein